MQISVKVSVTIERLERAIAVTAYCMTPQRPGAILISI